MPNISCQENDINKAILSSSCSEFLASNDLDFRGKFFKPNLDKNSLNPRSTGNEHFLLGVLPFLKYLFQPYRENFCRIKMNKIVRIQPMQYIHLLDLVGTSQIKLGAFIRMHASRLFVYSCDYAGL